MCCSLEVAKGVCVVATLLNIILGIVFVTQVRPKANEAVSRHLSAVEDAKRRSSHPSHDDVLLHASDGRKNSVAVMKYLQQHGLPNEEPDGLCYKYGTPCLWWKHSSEDPHSNAAVVVAFGGTFWLPWLRPHQVDDMDRPNFVGFHDIASSRLPQEDHPMIPPGEMILFSLNGTVPVRFQWSTPPLSTGAAVVFAKIELRSILRMLYRLLDSPNDNAHTREAKMQRHLGLLVRDMAESHIKGRDVLVYGSLRTPILEVLLLAIGGARRVFSVDLHPLNITDRRIVTMTPNAFFHCLLKTQPSDRCNGTTAFPRSFPVIVAYSVVQHAGLGRYGDTLDAFGDVKLMWTLRQLLRRSDPHAALILGVPLGNDCLMYNKYRVYGRRRLPLLLLGFNVFRVSGFDHEVHSGGASKKAALKFSEFWPVDDRCLGNSQQIPVMVLSYQEMKLSDAQGAKLIGTNSCLAVESDAVASWLRVPGLAGPFPFHG